MSLMSVKRAGEPGTLSAGRIAAVVMTAVLLLVGLTFSAQLIESVDQNEVMVVQYARTGELVWYTNGGMHLQWFGKVTKYPKRGVYEIEAPIRFNDGGHGTLNGSVQYELPLDAQHLTAIYTRFPDAESLKKSLIETVATKSVYMTGPLMSSRESYAEKRNDLIRYIEDQIDNGVYRTQQREVKIVDQLTGQEKSAVVAEIVLESGQPARQEAAVLKEFGIRTFNFSVKNLPYDETVEKQIKQQQEIAMGIQTSIAQARQAEQNAITAEQNGKAAAAQARWEQEVLKAKAVTAAEQQLAVAQLRNKEMDQYKESEVKRADADATYRRRIMEADGALEKKLATYQVVQQLWASAFQHFAGSLVPQVVSGGSVGQQNAALSFMDILTVKAARDLALDVAPRPVSSHGGQ
jgi:hypothetical protein